MTTEKTAMMDAIKSIVEVTDTELVVTNEDAAKELSQFIIDNGGNGSITGPFVDGSYRNKVVTHFTAKYWYVEK